MPSAAAGPPAGAAVPAPSSPGELHEARRHAGRQGLRHRGNRRHHLFEVLPAHEQYLAGLLGHCRQGATTRQAMTHLADGVTGAELVERGVRTAPRLLDAQRGASRHQRTDAGGLDARLQQRLPLGHLPLLEVGSQLGQNPGAAGLEQGSPAEKTRHCVWRHPKHRSAPPAITVGRDSPVIRMERPPIRARPAQHLQQAAQQ
jgi:hypothetical protein